MSAQDSQSTSDRPVADRLLDELELIRREGWWEFRARDVEILAGVCRRPLPGEKPEAPIQARLLDLMDPEGVDEHGRPLPRKLLSERDRRDAGLLARIVFAEPAKVSFDGPSGERSFKPREMPLMARYRQLELLRGDGKGTMNRSAKDRKPGKANQLLLDLRDALLLDLVADAGLGETTPPRQTAAATAALGERSSQRLARTLGRRFGLGIALLGLCTVIALTLRPESSSPSLTGVAASPTSPIGWWPYRKAVICGGDLLCGGAPTNALNRYVFRPTNGKPYPTGVPDERAFLSFANSSASQSPSDPLEVTRARQVTIIAVVDNAALASEANASRYGAEEDATAHDVRVSLLLPRDCRREQHIIGVVSNTEENGRRSEQVTDSATLRASKPICVKLVPNSGGFANRYIDEPLADSISRTYDPATFDRRTIFQSGPQVGCRRLDGRLFGSFSCAGHVTATLAVYPPGTKPDLTARPRNSRAELEASPIGETRGLTLRLSQGRREGPRVSDLAGRFDAVVALTSKTTIDNGTLELVLPTDAAPDAPIGARLRSSSGETTLVHAAAGLRGARFVKHGAYPAIRGPGKRGATLNQVTIPHADAGSRVTVRWPLVAITPRIKVTFMVRRPRGEWRRTLRYSSRETRISWRITIDSGGIGLDAPSLWLLIPRGLRLTASPVVESPNGQLNSMFLRREFGATTARGEAVNLLGQSRITIRFTADDISKQAPRSGKFVRLVLQSQGYQKSAGARIYSSSGR